MLPFVTSLPFHCTMNKNSLRVNILWRAPLVFDSFVWWKLSSTSLSWPTLNELAGSRQLPYHWLLAFIMSICRCCSLFKRCQRAVPANADSIKTLTCSYIWRPFTYIYGYQKPSSTSTYANWISRETVKRCFLICHLIGLVSYFGREICHARHGDLFNLTHISSLSLCYTSYSLSKISNFQKHLGFRGGVKGLHTISRLLWHGMKKCSEKKLSHYLLRQKLPGDFALLE